MENSRIILSVWAYFAIGLLQNLCKVINCDMAFDNKLKKEAVYEKISVVHSFKSRYYVCYGL